MSKYTRLNKINHYHDKVEDEQHHQRQHLHCQYHHHHHHHWSNQNMPLLSNNNNNSASNRIKPPPNNSSSLLQFNNKMSNNKKSGKLMLIINKEDSNSREYNIERKSKSLTEKLINYNNSKHAFFALTTNNKPIIISKLTISILFVISILLILSSTKQVYSLNCYHCSSADNPNCDESFSGKDNFTLPADTDCYKHIGREAKVCRKIIQNLENNKKVVIRSCGYIDEHYSASSNAGSDGGSSSTNLEKEKKSMCYKRSGTFSITMESCNCYTDNCNHSASLKPNQSVLYLSSFSLIIATILGKYIMMNSSR